MLLMAFLLTTASVFAGGNNRSTIRVRLSDNSPLMITVNGRDFKKIGRSITIGDLPGKRQNLQVYKYRRFADGKGGRAEQVFSGDIKIEKGSTYDCIVDIGAGKIRMWKVNALQPIAPPPGFNPRQSQPLNQDNADVAVAAGDTAFEMPPVHNVDDKLLPLKASMEKVDADSKKLELAMNYIGKNSYNSQDVTNIAGWIFFDDNRMKFVKQAYARVTDKNNYASVGDVFTLPDSKKEFSSFLTQR